MQKTFFTTSEIENLKQSVKITDYLAEHNYTPVSYKKNEWYYSSIGANEKTPSFRVNVAKNSYQDYSGNQDNTGRCGDIIRLVMHLEQCDFIDACNRLKTSNFSTFQPPAGVAKAAKDEKGTLEVKHVCSIQERALIKYLDNRCISLSLANMYLKEIHYTNAGIEYYALGFENDLGGYALRSPPSKYNSKGFKAQTKPAYYTTLHPHRETTACNVFEGFFSALSCLENYERFFFDNLTYVCNSVTNLSKILPAIPDYITHINLFLDNDDTGRAYTKKVIALDRFQVNDCATKYKGFKDFNEYLMNK